MNKGLILFLLGLLACQGFANAFAIEKEERSLVDDIKDIVQGIIDSVHDISEGLKSIIHEIVQHFGDKFNELVEEIRKYLQEHASDVQEEFRKFLQKIKEQLNELIDKAVEIEADVKKCKDAEKEKIEAIEQESKEAVKNCASPKIEIAKKIAKEVRDTVEKYKPKVLIIIKKLKNCGSNSFCLIGVANDAISLAKEIGSLGKGIVTEIVDLIKTIRNEVPACIREAMVPIRNEAIEVKNEIQKCIHDNLYG